MKKGTLKTYKGFPHGMPTTEAATINAVAPNDIVTGNRVKLDPMVPAGIQTKTLEAAQRLELLNVVKTFSGLMRGSTFI